MVAALFVPLAKPHFLAFERGEKREEWRRHGPRWHAGTCPIGRQILLCCGYRGARLHGRITSYREAPSGECADAVAIYGVGVKCAVIGIARAVPTPSPRRARSR